MPTRFYLPSTGASAVNPAYGGLWNTTASAARRLMSTTKNNTAHTDAAVAEAVATANYDVLIRQFVSSSLAAGPIRGWVSAVIRTLESAAAADFILNMAIRVVSSDGVTVRGWLLPCTPFTTLSATAGALNQEFAVTTAATRIINKLPLNVVHAQANDRLVVELGYRSLNTATTSRTGTLRFGDLTATADFALTSALTTDLVPWVEFEQDLFTTRTNDASPPDLNLQRNSDFSDDALNAEWTGAQSGSVSFPASSGVSGGKCLRLTTATASNPYALAPPKLWLPISPEMIGQYLTTYGEFQWDSVNTPNTTVRHNIYFYDENLVELSARISTPFTPPAAPNWTREQNRNNAIPANTAWAVLRPIINNAVAGDAVLVDRLYATIGSDIAAGGPHPTWSVHPDEYVAPVANDPKAFFQFI